MNKVVVVGANGFIGSHLSLHLAAQGYQVLTLVQKGFPYDFLQNKDNITCLDFSFDDIHLLNGNPNLEGATMLYHLAWAGVSTTFKNEAITQAQNILYGIKVLEFADTNEIRRVIVPGSASEYACGKGIIDGHNIPAPSDLYSASKIANTTSNFFGLPSPASMVLAGTITI